MLTDYLFRAALILCLLVPVSVHASGTVTKTAQAGGVSSCTLPYFGGTAYQASGDSASCFALWLEQSQAVYPGMIQSPDHPSWYLQAEYEHRIDYTIYVWYPTNTVGATAIFYYAAPSCPANSTDSGGSTCTCNSGYVPDGAGTACVSDCPHTYLGVPVSGGYGFTTNDIGAGYQGCDNYGCAVNVSQLTRLFGVSLAMISVSSNVCPNDNQPNNPPVNTLSVSFTSSTDQQKVNFDAVGAKAALVDSATTAAATSNASAAASAAPNNLSGLESNLQQVTSAATARDNAYNAVQTAANNFFNNPSSGTLSSYNNAMTTYNNAVNALNPLLTQLYGNYAVATATKTAADSAILTSKTVQDNIAALDAAITASGQPFDTAAITTQKGDTTALGAAITVAETALSTANTRLTAVQTTGNEIIANTSTVTTSITEMATAVQTVTTGAGGAVSGVPTAPTADFCAANPTAVQCLVPPEPSFCESNPDAVQCAGLGEVGDSVLGTKTTSVAITPVTVGGAGACPAPSPMVLHGQTYFFKWDTYCNYATGIKPILLVFAWLSAAGILVGGFKS